MVEKATYFPEPPYEAQLLVVLKKNDDSTVELGNEKGELVIGKCPVSKARAIGHCIIETEAPIETAPVQETAPVETAPADNAGASETAAEADNASGAATDPASLVNPPTRRRQRAGGAAT